MKFKEVAHLYLGCQIDGKVDPSFTLTTEELHLIDFWIDSNKPILRPLSDMTEDEADNIGIEWLSNYGSEDKFSAAQFHNLLSLHFDLFGLIEIGEAIDSTKF